MASLNRVRLDPDTFAPVLPAREKTLVTLGSVSISLVPRPAPPARASASRPPVTAPEYKVNHGTVHLSNERIVYVAPRGTCHPLETLSVPYSDLRDAKFQQPFFGANYYEATCAHALDGGLPCPYDVRLYFRVRAGGQFDFWSIVNEMKERSASQLLRDTRQTPPVYTANYRNASASPRSHCNHPPAVPRPAPFDPPQVPSIGYDAPPPSYSV